MKKLTIILMLALLISPVLARNTSDVFHEVQVVDELGNDVTDITSVTILNPGSTVGSPTIYRDRNRQNTITQPMTTSSTNTTLSNGRFSWYGPSNWDFTITDGTNIANNADHRDRTASEGTLVFPSYLTSISTTTYTDAQSATFGTTDSAQLQYIAGTAFRFTPSSDGIIFQVGVPSGNQFDTVFLVGGGTDGLTIDEGAATLVWTGGAASLNNSGSGATNIGVGSTGAISIGDSASGVWSIDGTTTGTINADDSIGITTSGAAADITVDALVGSVIVDGGEAAADAVIIRATGAAGGIDITSLADIDITTTGTAGEDISLTNTGGSIVVTATEAIADAIGLISTGGVDITAAATFDIDLTATGGKCLVVASEAAADQFKVDATGTVAGNAINLETTDGGVLINADGAANGDIELNSADDMTMTVAGDYTLAVTGSTVLPNDVLLKTTTAILDTEMDNLAATPIELVAAVAGNTIEFVSAIYALDWATTAWTEPSAPDDLVIRFENTTGRIVSALLDATGFATATEDTVAFVDGTVADAAGAAVANVAVTEANSTNKALVLHNTGSEWTNSGDSQVVVIVYYRLHTTAELGL